MTFRYVRRTKLFTAGFALWISRLWENAARLGSCEGMRPEFYQHQGPRAIEQIYRRERKVGQGYLREGHCCQNMCAVL